MFESNDTLTIPIAVIGVLAGMAWRMSARLDRGAGSPGSPQAGSAQDVNGGGGSGIRRAADALCEAP